MRVDRKGEVAAGGLEGQGAGAEAVKGAKPAPLTDEIAKPGSQPFVEKLFSSLLADIRGNLETLQARVDEAASEMVEKPNQVTLDEYKEAVSHLVAFILDNSVTIQRAHSLKKGKDGKPKEFLRVEIINEKMSALANEVLKSQKPMLDLVNRLDEIRGLLVDFYDWPARK